MTRGARPSTLLLVGLVALGLVIAPVAPAAAGDGFVHLTTELSPAQPTTADEFTFTTILGSAESSTETYRVRRIEVREGTGSDADTLASADYFGRTHPTLGPGGTFRKGFELGFADPGTHELVVEITLLAGDRNPVTVTHHVNVTVYRPHPQLEGSAEPTTVGQRTAMDVLVANGLQNEIRDLELSLSAPNVSFQEPSRVGASIAGGGSSTFTFTATPAALGTQPVVATLAYTDANGTRKRVTRTLQVAFTAPEVEGRVNLAADVATALPGAETSLNLTVTNGLDRAIREFEVAIAAEGVSIRQHRRVGTRLESGASRAFTFAVTRPDAGEQPVDVTVSYTTENGVVRQFTRTLSTTFAAPPNPGSLSLTGLSFTRDGEQLQVSGSAANTGGTPISGVIIRVGSSEAVQPGATESEFFVGTVEASDFVSFDVNARLLRNESPVAVPLEVRYTVGDVERQRVVEVTYQTAGDSTSSEATDRSGLPLASLGMAAAVGVVVILALWGWRRGRA